MTYIIVSIANAGGAPEQAYRKLQSAGACPDRPYAGTHFSLVLPAWLPAWLPDKGTSIRKQTI
jgi:hypothetical protein